jgi:sulfur-oxidizing protein SoxY
LTALQIPDSRPTAESRESAKADVAAAAINGRRKWLAAGAGLGAAVLLRPIARAQPALGLPDELAAAINGFAGGKAVLPGRIKLDISPIVDNGNSVAMTVTVDSPMTPGDRVTAIAIFNERNPQRDVAKFRFGTRAGRASVATRIRLATSQKLVAVAELSDGTYWSHSVDVLVALAACID